ncbi:UNVERIFIED_CONTAM: hypothetical protein Sradi_5846600 [Sesamum radiatum]|uniref:Uncharacterized protein n=1 Tax=Sesamum radiatum TaxID=300843 RepID=A0AAW2KR77_SESRA
MVAGQYLRFAFEACRQQFIAWGYPPVGEDTSFLNFELVLDTAPDLFAGPALTAKTTPIESDMVLFDLGSIFTRLLIMAWVCFSDGDLDHILGEAKAEVRGEVGQAEAAVEDGRAPDEGLPPPRVKTSWVLQGRLLRRKKRKRSVARPHLWGCDLSVE